MDRNINESFKFNQETEFVPVLGQIASELNEEKKVDTPSMSASSIQNNHHPQLLALLASELAIAPEEIHDFELYVYLRQHTFTH